MDVRELILLQPDGSPLLGAEGETLTIDIATVNWPAADQPLPEDVHICFSGVHGAEGHCGSEAQARWLVTEVSAASRPTIVVHSVNPHGMSAGRRWNEGGVDLNRNLHPRHVLDPALAAAPSPWAATGVHPIYQALHHRINPTATRVAGVVAVGSWVEFALLALAMLAACVRLGFAELSHALSRGQAAHPTGLFFSGHRLEQGPRLLFAHLAALLRYSPSTSSPEPPAAAVRRVVFVDLHTGLGKYGAAYVVCDSEADVPWFRERAAPGTEFSKVDKQEVYPGETAFAIRELMAWLAPSAVVRAATLEVGTFSKLSAFRLLRADATHHRVRLAAGASAAELARRDTPERAAVVEMYYPGVKDPRWRVSAQRATATFLRGVFSPAPAAAAAAGGGVAFRGK